MKFHTELVAVKHEGLGKVVAKAKMNCPFWHSLAQMNGYRFLFSYQKYLALLGFRAGKSQPKTLVRDVTIHKNIPHEW